MARKIFLHEVSDSIGMNIQFLSVQEDVTVAYLHYCIAHQKVPNKILNWETWSSISNNKYRNECAEQSYEVAFEILPKKH